MISSELAARELDRMSGLDFFPKTTAALKELRLALESAATPAIATAFVSDWLATSTVCPKPAEIRKPLWDRAESLRAAKAACTLCSGEGARVAFHLVSYDGASLKPKASQRIGYEFPHELAEQLANNPGSVRQMITSAAEPCACVRTARIAS